MASRRRAKTEMGGKSIHGNSSKFSTARRFFPTLKLATVSEASATESARTHRRTQTHAGPRVARGERTEVGSAPRAAASQLLTVGLHGGLACLSLGLPVDRPDQWERRVRVTSRVISLPLTNYESNQLIPTLTNQEECVFHPFSLNSR